MPEYVLNFTVGGDCECSSHEHLVFVKFDGDADDLMLALETAAQEFIDKQAVVSQHNKVISSKYYEMVIAASKMRLGMKKEEAYAEAVEYQRKNIIVQPNYYDAKVDVPGTGKAFHAYTLIEENRFNEPCIEELLSYVEQMISATEA